MLDNSIFSKMNTTAMVADNPWVAVTQCNTPVMDNGCCHKPKQKLTPADKHWIFFIFQSSISECLAG